MKQVKLYSLKEDIVTVSGDYIPYMSHNNNKPSYISDSNEFVFDVPIEVQHIKIEKVINNGKEYLVAFDPAIKKVYTTNSEVLQEQLTDKVLECNKLTHKVTLLEGDVKALDEYNDLLLKDVESLKKRNNDLQEEYAELFLKHVKYVGLSFWKRLMFLFTGKV